jgi:isopentenyldiphosphate isomerase
MVSEIITTYDAESPVTAIQMKRDDFYREQVDLSKKGKKPSKAVAVVNVLMFDTKGEIFIQKRSSVKAHNPGLFDKSMGGHIRFGDTADYTVMVETIQELQIPSIVLRNDQDFIKTFDLLYEYLNSIAIVKHIDTKNLTLVKKIKSDDVPVINRFDLYFGVYNGSVKTVDREAKGIILYTIDDLKESIEAAPTLFTNDLAMLISRYNQQILEFIKLIKKK